MEILMGYTVVKIFTFSYCLAYLQFQCGVFYI